MSVIAEDNGKIVGYILGTPDTTRQQRLFYAKIGWRILLRLFFITFWRYFQDIKMILYFLRIPPSEAPSQEIIQKFPAHLHIDILKSYQRKGIGSNLMQQFEDHIRKLQVQGIHLETSEGNYKALPFYKKMGFKIIHVDKIGMWPSAPEKRGLIFAKSLL